MRRKIRVKQRMCLTGALLFAISFMFAVLSFFDSRFFALFLFTLCDWIVTVIPSYGLIVEEEVSE